MKSLAVVWSQPLLLNASGSGVRVRGQGVPQGTHIGPFSFTFTCRFGHLFCSVLKGLYLLFYQLSHDNEGVISVVIAVETGRSSSGPLLWSRSIKFESSVIIKCLVFCFLLYFGFLSHIFVSCHMTPPLVFIFTSNSLVFVRRR